MWRRVSCEQPLHTSQSILSPRRIPMLMVRVCAWTAIGRKGMLFLFSNSVSAPLARVLITRRGDANNPGEAVGSCQKSFLFCLSHTPSLESPRVEIGRPSCAKSIALAAVLAVSPRTLKIRARATRAADPNRTDIRSRPPRS